MNYEEISKLQESYASCMKCDLSDHRIAGSEKIVLGQGRIDAVGLIVIPTPIFTKPQYPAAYAIDSEEYEILSQIFKKTGLSLDDWYITPTVMCKGRAKLDHLLACNERLSELVKIISPKYVVLMGKQSYYSFFGVSQGKEDLGWISNKNYKTFYTHNLSEYIGLKTKNDSKCQNMAKTMMNHWKTIKEEMDLLT